MTASQANLLLPLPTHPDEDERTTMGRACLPHSSLHLWLLQGYDFARMKIVGQEPWWIWTIAGGCVTACAPDYTERRQKGYLTMCDVYASLCNTYIYVMLLVLQRSPGAHVKARDGRSSAAACGVKSSAAACGVRYAALCSLEINSEKYCTSSGPNIFDG